MASSAHLNRRRDSVDLDALQRLHPAPEEWMETMYVWEPDRIEWMQKVRLEQELQRASSNAFYKHVWSERGFDHRSVSNLSDLPTIPTYTIDDLRASIERRPPFGDFQGIDFAHDDARSAKRVFFSGGTTGKPRPHFYTQWDWMALTIMAARTMYLAGIRPGDVVLNSWSYGTHIVGLLADEALSTWLGCLPIATSTGQVTPTLRQLELAIEFEAASIVAIGDYLVHMAEKAVEYGFDPHRDFAFRGFPGPAGGRSEAISALWGVPSYESYGTHEMGWISGECHARGGMHIYEDAAIVEIVDVDSGEPLPEGERGNLVVTALHKTGAPVVRFNTLDVSALHPRERCECGSWLRKMDYFGGRSDNMVKLRGTNVWPEGVGAVATDHPATPGEYFVEAYSEGEHDRMRVRVETTAAPDEWDTITRQLQEKIRSTIEVSIDVHLCAPGSLAELTGLGVRPKPVRFKDERKRFSKVEL